DVVFSPDGRLAATAAGGREVRLWEVGTGRPVGQPLLHAQEVTALAFSPDGGLLLTVCGEHLGVPRPLLQGRWWHTLRKKLEGGARTAVSAAGQWWETSGGLPV